MTKKNTAIIAVFLAATVILFFLTPFFPLDELVTATIAAGAIVKEFM